jgi:hypothetical protein
MILTAAVMRSSVFWDIRQSSATDAVEEHVAFMQSYVRYLLHAGSLLGIFFDPDEGSDIFLRNIC